MLIITTIAIHGFLSGILVALYCHLMLASEKNNKQLILIWSVLGLWGAVGNLFLMDQAMKEIIYYGVFLLIWMTILYFCYEGAISKKLYAIMLLAIGWFISNVIVKLIYDLNGKSQSHIRELSFARVIYMIVCFAFQFVVYLSILQVQNFRKNKYIKTEIIPLILLPLSQICFGLGVESEYYLEDASNKVFLFMGETLGFVLCLYWLYWIWKENRRKELEEKMNSIQETIQKEKDHYLEIENKREMLSQIRNEMRDQIDSVQGLIEEKNKEGAVQVLDDLTDMLYATKEYTFCSVPIVNAVMEEKGKECQKQNILLEADIKIPYNHNISEMVLCSIFSNLMDNAIRGASEHAAETKCEGYVRISALYEGGFCIIKTVNNSKKPEKKLRKGHGKGTVILQDIAKYYGGSFKSEFADETFTAIVILRY